MRIGNVERTIRPSSLLTDAQRLKIPSGYLQHLEHDTAALSHLQWLLQKDVLQQDALLVGTSGAAAVQRRRLALAYAELTQRPVELLTLSPDTTEADLKQRRTLIHSTTSTSSSTSTSTSIAFQDQAPVRAALQGHLLILDGLHVAERNVLPTLNNLLENRELPLEDGRLLVSAERYQYLLQQQQQQSSSAPSSRLDWLVPVHAEFRCLALLSVDHHHHHGRKLDPPVRSRFQIRRVDGAPTDRLYEQMLDSSSDDHDDDLAKQLAVFAATMEESAGSSSSSPAAAAAPLPFPVATTLASIRNAKTLFPEQPLTDLLARAYPYAATDGRLADSLQRWSAAVASREAFQRTCRELGILQPQPANNRTAGRAATSGALSSLWCYDVDRVERTPQEESPYKVQVQLRSLQPSSSSLSSMWGPPGNETVVTVTVPSGGKFANGAAAAAAD